MKKQGKAKKIFCSFCGKSHDEVVKIVQGKDGNICVDCLDVCVSLMGRDILNSIDNTFDSYKEEAIPTKEAGKSKAKDNITLLSPKEIYDQLCLHVIGQDDAKRTLSVAVYNHYKRVLNLGKVSKKLKDVELTKSNVLMVGPTGVGKTLLAQTLAKILNVPFAIADATSLTEAGYVGDDVESIISRLLQAANYDVEKAQKGIIYIDEIDKIARKGENISITRDVSGEGVQHSLLKIIEGTVSHVVPQGGRKNPMADTIAIDTSNILFICGGAFSGIDKIIEQRIHKSSIGFNAVIKENDNKDINISESLIEEDLFRYGLIQELVGRLPVIVCLDKIDEDTIYRILKEPKNALTLQYQKLFAMDGIKLNFEDEALKDIAKNVSQRSLGARGARAYLERILKDAMFDTPSLKDTIKEVLIDKEVANNKKKPILISKS